jgi:hypothetical protein
MNERGQTAYDYLLGVTILMLVVLASLALFPQIFGPFVDPVSSDQKKMADRAAAELIDSSDTMFGERTLNLSALEATVDDDSAVDRLKARAGIPEAQKVHVTVQRGVENRLIEQNDERPPSRPTATVVRQVRGVTGEYDCDTGCQLVVRVW